MSPVASPFVTILSAAFLLSAVADSAVPASEAPSAAPAHSTGAILMPIAGVPDSQVYVYPMTAGEHASDEAAMEQLKTFAAMFHAADPAIYRDFAERWAQVRERRVALDTATPAERPAGAN